MRSRFHISRPIPGPMGPGDKVECVDASGTSLRRGGIYTVDQAHPCPMCGGGLRLTSGPRPTDVPCGWWRVERFRPLRGPDAETIIEAAKRGKRHKAPAPKTPVRVPDLEDA